MIWLLMLFVSVVCAFVQAAVPPAVALGGAKLPLLLAVVVYYSLNHDTGTGCVAALVCGVIHDLLASMPLGQTSMVFVIVAVIAGRFRKLVHGDRLFTAGAFSAIGAFFAVFMGYYFLKRVGLVEISGGKLWLRAIGSILLGGISAPFVFLAVHKLDSLVGNIATSEVIEDVLD